MSYLTVLAEVLCVFLSLSPFTSFRLLSKLLCCWTALTLWPSPLLLLRVCTVSSNGQGTVFGDKWEWESQRCRDNRNSVEKRKNVSEGSLRSLSLSLDFLLFLCFSVRLSVTVRFFRFCSFCHSPLFFLFLQLQHSKSCPVRGPSKLAARLQVLGVATCWSCLEILEHRFSLLKIFKK